MRLSTALFGAGVAADLLERRRRRRRRGRLVDRTAGYEFETGWPPGSPLAKLLDQVDASDDGWLFVSGVIRKRDHRGGFAD